MSSGNPIVTEATPDSAQENDFVTVYGDPLDSKVLKEMQEEIAASLTRGRAGFFDPSLRPMAESGRGRLSK